MALQLPRFPIPEFPLQVANGDLSSAAPLVKFGKNNAVGTSYETIWTPGGLYSYPASASTVFVSSSSTDDDVSGTGARTVLVEGLDANYDEVSETVELDGQTQVETSTAFLRVFRAKVLTAGSGGTAAGDIYVATTGEASGVPSGTTYAKIDIGENQTLMAVYTVPDDKVLILVGSIFAVRGSSNVDMTVGIYVRESDGVFQVKREFTVASQVFPLPYTVPLSIPARADVEIRAKAETGSGFVSGELQGYLIDNA